MLKILYLFTSASLKNSSVQNKVISQINALNKIDNVSCKGVFFISTFEKTIESTNSNIEFVCYKPSSKKLFDKIRNNNILFECVSKYLKNQKVDKIYLRYSNCNFKLIKIAKKHNNLVVEINDPSLTSIPANKTPFKLKPSVIFHLFQEYYYPMFTEKYLAPYFFRKVNTVVSVSEELWFLFKKWYELSNTKYIIMGNGIDVEKFEPRIYNPNTKEFKLLILKGASSKADYLGLDRVFKGLLKYKGTNTFRIICAGNQFENEKEFVKVNGLSEQVEFTGYLNTKEIDALISETDLAIGTLAPYRIGIGEISSLKAREYVARGVPFIYGYLDTDLQFVDEMNQFTMRVNNNDEFLDFNKIAKFINENIRTNTKHPNEMNHFAKLHLDWNIKMKNMLNSLIKNV